MIVVSINENLKIITTNLVKEKELTIKGINSNGEEHSEVAIDVGT